MVVGKNNKKCQSPAFVSHLIDSEQSENYNEFAMKCVSLIFSSYIFFIVIFVPVQMILRIKFIMIVKTMSGSNYHLVAKRLFIELNNSGGYCLELSSFS